MLIYFVLLFTGLAFSAFGYRFGIWGFVIAGVLWILVTPFAVRSTVPAEIRKWSIIFLLLGATLGTAAGIVLGEAIRPLVGLVGGGMIGGVGSWILYVLVMDKIHFLLEKFLPKLSMFILYAVFLLGVIWGSISLGEVMPKYFENIGGSLLIGGVFGSFAGIWQGAEILRQQGEDTVQTIAN